MRTVLLSASDTGTSRSRDRRAKYRCTTTDYVQQVRRPRIRSRCGIVGNGYGD